MHKVEHKSQLYKVIGETIFNMEFDFFAYGIRHTAPFNRPKTFIHSTYPEGWSEHYIAHNYVMIDPAVKHGSISNELFIWSEKAYQQSRSLWDDAQQTGICVGASMSSFLPYNALGVISVSRKDTKISEHEASLLTGKLRILGDLIRDTLIRLNDEELVTPLMSMPMSDREKEVLRAANKTP
nr:autoinducer binding domain-containing protein [Pseudomonas luteola]